MPRCLPRWELVCCAAACLAALWGCDEHRAQLPAPPQDVEFSADTVLELDAPELLDTELLAELPPFVCELPFALRETELAPSPEPIPLEIAPCELLLLRFVAVAEQRLSFWVRITDERPVELSIAYPDVEPWGQPLVSAAAVSTQRALVLDWTAPRGGEFVLALRARKAEEGASLRLGFECMSHCALRSTRHPIVLVHGWTGWESLRSYDYFFRVPDDLREDGGAVYVASLDPYNSVEVRAAQLAQFFDEVLAQHHARQVNVIAHSQGGLDTRRAISALGYGDRVAALVTISTPHRGTPLSDVALGILPGEAQDVLSFLLNLLGAVSVGSESDAKASFASLTETWVQQEFNPQHPDDPRVSYFSYAGKCCGTGEGCGDLCDIEIQLTHHLLQAISGDNDGIVPVSSAIWGEYLGEIPADHFDQVGQLAGVTGPNFDHLAFYRSVKGLLIERGF